MAMRPSEQRPKFLSDPHWSNQQINWSLKKRRFIPFNSVAQKEQDPTADETGGAGFPAEQSQKNQTGENQGNADAVEKLVPGRTMFVILLAHVVR
jgi:hypothetical protein